MKISYSMKTGMLFLKLDDTIPVEIIKENLVCWKRYGPDPTFLQAQGLTLAYNEAKEFIPNLVLGASMENFFIERKSETHAPDHVTLAGLKPVQMKPTWILKNRQRAILTATPGLGKTVMTLTALKHTSPEFTLIVCSKSLVDNWVEELNTWWFIDAKSTGLRTRAIVWHTRKEATPYTFIPGCFNVLITTLETITALFKEERIDEFIPDGGYNSTLVLDESFLVKNRKAQRSEPMVLLASKFDRAWLLSGMPISRFSDDLYMQLRILYPKVFTSYWRFAHRYCYTEMHTWGESVVEDKPGATEKLQNDLGDILIPCEFPDDVPDWIPVTVEVEMHEDQVAIYTQLAAEKKVEASKMKRDEPLTLKALISLTGRLLQIASNPMLVGGPYAEGKWSKLLEMLATEELPALVWVAYTVTGHALAERILENFPHLSVGIMDGSTPVPERTRLKKLFQAGQLAVLIVHPGVGKYGHTLTAAKVAYYLERTWDGEAYFQTLFRARRITSKHSVKLVYLLSTLPGGKPTIDHLVHNTVTKRSKNAMKLSAKELIGSL